MPVAFATDIACLDLWGTQLNIAGVGLYEVISRRCVHVHVPWIALLLHTLYYPGQPQRPAFIKISFQLLASGPVQSSPPLALLK